MKFINSFYLKIIGIVTMTIDHIGYVLYPNNETLRIIGRIAFPIFAFLIAEGFRHTSDKYKYLLRLTVFALVIQAPFFINDFLDLNILGVNVPTNIFFTLALGLYALIILNESKKNYWQLLLVVLLAFLFDVDYGLYGVILIVIMYYFKDALLALVVIGYNLIFYFGRDIFPTIFAYDTYKLRFSSIQVFSIMSVLFIIMYNSKRGIKMKYFFYIYYPLHLIILYGISYLI